jgi:hypothetical protein
MVLLSDDMPLTFHPAAAAAAQTLHLLRACGWPCSSCAGRRQPALGCDARQRLCVQLRGVGGCELRRRQAHGQLQTGQRSRLLSAEPLYCHLSRWHTPEPMVAGTFAPQRMPVGWGLRGCGSSSSSSSSAQAHVLGTISPKRNRH